MEVNSEKTYMLKGISLKRVMRSNCPRGIRSSSLFSPLLVCIGLATFIITHSVINNHFIYNGPEQTIQTNIMTSVKSATASTTKLFVTTTIIEKNIKVADIIQPYDWVRDDFFSPHKGKVITNNERKYKPKRPLRFDNIKSESKNLQNNISILKKDTENTINKNIEEKSFDFASDNSKTQVGTNGVMDSLIGPNSILQSFSKGEPGINPGGTLLGLVAAGVKQWKKSTSGNTQGKKQPQIKDSISRNAANGTILNNSSSFKGKHISSNDDAKTEEPTIRKGKNDQRSGDISVRSNHKDKNPLGPVLSNIAPLASLFMKPLVKPSNSHHKPASLAESLMENIGPVLLQNAIGRLTNPTDDEDKLNSPVKSLMRNIGPMLLKNAIGRLTNPTDDEDKLNSPVKSLMGNIGPMLLKNAIGRLTNPTDNEDNGPISQVESLVRNIGPAVLQGVMNGAGRGGQEHAGGPISPVESLFRNLGPAVLQGVMNGGGRGRGEQQPSDFMSIIAKAAPKLLNGFLKGGKARPEDMKKSQPKSKPLSKRVAFADSPHQIMKQEYV